MRIIESQKFDIDVTESKDYKGESKYMIRYGLSYKMAHSLADAMQSFKHCLEHAMQCEGLQDEH